jgi:hypothetical protein
MADDMAQEVERRRDVGNPAGTVECLVDVSKRIVRVGLGQADDDKAISTALVRRIIPKCLPLKLLFDQPGDVLQVPGYGHGGYIRQAPIQMSPGGTARKYSVIPVTAKHNLRQVCVTNPHTFGAVSTVFTPASANFEIPRMGEVPINSQELGWVPNKSDVFDLRPPGSETSRPAVCPWGVDVSVGTLVDSATASVTDASYSFDLVRESYKPEKGHKVGMAVLFNDQSKPTQKTIVGLEEKEANISNKEIEAIFGRPGTVNIYTGNIKYVGSHHIEYDLNSFTGCSGAIIFLLDGQSDSVQVQECDYGKAIAVHSGAHPCLVERNYGFLIRSHPNFN